MTVRDTGTVNSANAYNDVPGGTLAQGVKYYWQVRVKDGGGLWGNYSTTQYFYVLAAPSNLALTPGQTTVDATWSSNGNPSGTIYQLWRSSTLIYEGTGLSYTDTGLTPNTTYQYSVNAKGDNGGATASVSAAVTTDPLPTATTVEYIYDANGRLTRRVTTLP